MTQCSNIELTKQPEGCKDSGIGAGEDGLQAYLEHWPRRRGSAGQRQHLFLFLGEMRDANARCEMARKYQDVDSGMIGLHHGSISKWTPAPRDELYVIDTILGSVARVARVVRSSLILYQLPITSYHAHQSGRMIPIMRTFLVLAPFNTSTP